MSKLTDLTIDMTKLRSIPIQQRAQLAKSPLASDIFGDLTPSQIASLFPNYYRQQLKLDGMTKAASGRSVRSGTLKSGSPNYNSGGTATAYTPPSVVDRIIGAANPAPTGATSRGALMAGLQQRGFTRQEAAAVVGNIYAESGYKAHIVNGIGAVGYMQWLKERKQGLIAYADSKGKSWQDPEIQMDWIAMERSGESVKFGGTNEKGAYARAFASGDVAQMGYDFGRFVERPSDSELAGSAQKRMNEAVSAHQDDSASPVTETPPSDTGQLGTLPTDGGTTAAVKPIPFNADNLTPELRKEYDDLSPEKKREFEKAVEKIGMDSANKIAEANIGDTASAVTTIKKASGEEVKVPRFQVMRGDIKDVDPRLTSVLKAASQDLPEGYTVKTISGRDDRSTGTKNHPNGLAIDVQIYDQNGDLVPYDRNSPGWKEYEKLYRSVHIRGEQMFPDQKFIWGGAWISQAAGRGDPMHYQIVDPNVPGSSQSSGRYSFENGLDPSHPFVQEGGQLTPDERKAYDASVRAKIDRPDAAEVTPNAHSQNGTDTGLIQLPTDGQPTATPVSPEVGVAAPSAPVDAPPKQKKIIEDFKPDVPTQDLTVPKMRVGGIVPNSVEEPLEIRNRETGEVLAAVRPDEKLTTTPNGLQVESAPKIKAQELIQKSEVSSPQPAEQDKIASTPARTGSMTSTVSGQDHLTPIANMETPIYSPSANRALRQATLGASLGHYNRGTELE